LGLERIDIFGAIDSFLHGTLRGLHAAFEAGGLVYVGNLAALQTFPAIPVHGAGADLGNREAEGTDIFALLSATIVCSLAQGEAEGGEAEDVLAGLPANAIGRRLARRKILAPAAVLWAAPLLPLLALAVAAIPAPSLAILRTVHRVLPLLALTIAAAIRRRAILGAAPLFAHVALAIATLVPDRGTILRAVVVILPLFALAVATLRASLAAICGAQFLGLAAVALTVPAEWRTHPAIQRAADTVLGAVALAVAAQRRACSAVQGAGLAVLRCQANLVSTACSAFPTVERTGLAVLRRHANLVSAASRTLSAILGA